MKTSRVKVYRNSNHTWRLTWIIAIALMILSKIFKHHLFYSYYYFFIVGVISLIYSSVKYASIDPMSLSICYGNIFNRKCIDLPWGKVKSAELSFIKKSHKRTIGGRVRIPITQTVEQEAILLTLNDPSPIGQLMKKDNSSNNFIDEIEIDEKNSGIILKTPPNVGFKRMILDIGKHVPINISASDLVMLKPLYYAISILNALIFFTAIILGMTL